MLSFCGQFTCSIDANARLKLPPKFISDFTSGGGDVVLYCLPEGAVAIYPESVYKSMRQEAVASVERAGSSLVARRSLRRFGALTAPETITSQGRVTLPQHFRDFADLAPGDSVVLVGVEIGIEIWNRERWNRELNAIDEHIQRKGEQELAFDLHPGEVLS